MLTVLNVKIDLILKTVSSKLRKDTVLKYIRTVKWKTNHDGYDGP